MDDGACNQAPSSTRSWVFWGGLDAIGAGDQIRRMRDVADLNGERRKTGERVILTSPQTR